MENQQSKYQVPFYVLAVIIAVWGVFGLIGSVFYGFAGFKTDGNKTVDGVVENSPAEAAGLQEGDYIVSIDGVEVEDADIIIKAHPAIGETRQFVVQRNGEEVVLDLTYGIWKMKYKIRNFLSFGLGLVFLICGLWIFRCSSSKAGFIFSLFAVLFAGVYFDEPYSSSTVLQGFFDFMNVIFVLTGTALLAYFMILFPDPRPILQRKSFRFWMLGPALLGIIAVILIGITSPDATSSLRTSGNSFMGIIVLYYAGWFLLTLFLTYRQNSAAERQQKGLNLMLTGVVLGLGLPLLIDIVSAIAPGITIPGLYNVYFIFLAIFPIMLALGIRKKESAKPAQA